MNGLFDSTSPLGYLLFFISGAIITALVFYIAKFGVYKAVVRNNEKISWLFVSFIIFSVSLMYFIFNNEFALYFQSSNFIVLFIGFLLLQLSFFVFYYKVMSKNARQRYNIYVLVFFLVLYALLIAIFSNNIINTFNISNESLIIIIVIDLITALFIFRFKLVGVNNV